MKNYLRLNDGNNIPILGLGTWKSEPNLVGKAVKFAILNSGYRHIDCAAIYRNELEVGEVLKEIIGKKVKRRELFISSKLWNTEHRPKRAEKACKKTLSDLHLEYLDLYLMHWGVAFKPDRNLEPVLKDGKVIIDKVSIQETWTAMESLVRKGLVKSIGVSNFTTIMLVDLLTYAKIKPAVNQIELHPYHTQEELVAFCKSKGIAVTAYSPLGRPGVLDIQAQNILGEVIIKRLAKKYKKTPAQILLNWAINRETIAIPKSVTKERISENIDIFDFELTKTEQTAISALNRNLRIVNPGQWWGIPYFI